MYTYYNSKDIYNSDTREQGFATQVANINNEQRKNLARIVEQNGTYSDFYNVKYAEQDKKLVAENKTAIDAHLSAKKAYEALKSAHEKALNELKQKQQELESKESNKLSTMEAKLKEKGLTFDSDYEYTDEGRKYTYKWKANSGRFSQEYCKWQKQLIADIWSSDTVEKARAFVSDFLKASGKSVSLED